MKNLILLVMFLSSITATAFGQTVSETVGTPEHGNEYVSTHLGSMHWDIQQDIASWTITSSEGITTYHRQFNIDTSYLSTTGNMYELTSLDGDITINLELVNIGSDGMVIPKHHYRNSYSTFCGAVTISRLT